VKLKQARRIYVKGHHKQKALQLWGPGHSVVAALGLEVAAHLTSQAQKEFSKQRWSLALQKTAKAEFILSWACEHAPQNSCMAEEAHKQLRWVRNYWVKVEYASAAEALEKARWLSRKFRGDVDAYRRYQLPDPVRDWGPVRLNLFDAAISYTRLLNEDRLPAHQVTAAKLKAAIQDELLKPVEEADLKAETRKAEMWLQEVRATALLRSRLATEQSDSTMVRATNSNEGRIQADLDLQEATLQVQVRTTILDMKEKQLLPMLTAVAACCEAWTLLVNRGAAAQWHCCKMCDKAAASATTANAEAMNGGPIDVKTVTKIFEEVAAVRSAVEKAVVVQQGIDSATRVSTGRRNTPRCTAAAAQHVRLALDIAENLGTLDSDAAQVVRRDGEEFDLTESQMATNVLLKTYTVVVAMERRSIAVLAEVILDSIPAEEEVCHEQDDASLEVAEAKASNEMLESGEEKTE